MTLKDITCLNFLVCYTVPDLSKVGSGSKSIAKSGYSQPIRLNIFKLDVCTHEALMNALCQGSFPPPTKTYSKRPFYIGTCPPFLCCTFISFQAKSQQMRADFLKMQGNICVVYAAPPSHSQRDLDFLKSPDLQGQD